MSDSRNDYDSARPTRVFHDTFKALWNYRELIVLLVQRDLSVRYKRSLLGLFWTLLNPLLTSLVLWFVFINAFSQRLPSGIDFAPYVLAGVLLITFFTQGLNIAADSIAANAGILMKVYVPPQVFAFSAALFAAFNFVMGLSALVILSVAMGSGISWFFPVTILMIAAMVLFITGLALLLSVIYIRFQDTKNIVTIFISFMMFLSPVFYPKEILAGKMLLAVNCNPLTSYLDVLRHYFLNSGTASVTDWIFVLSSSILIFLLGIRVFVKSWPRIVVML